MQMDVLKSMEKKMDEMEQENFQFRLNLLKSKNEQGV